MPSLWICGTTRERQPVLHDDMPAMWDADDERSVKNYLQVGKNRNVGRLCTGGSRQRRLIMLWIT